KQAKWKGRAIHERALAWSVTAHLVCKTDGLVIRQADFARLLGVSRDTVNRVLHELVAWRFVASHARAKGIELAAGGAGHHRLANRYTVTEHAIAYWSIAPRKGRKSSRDLLSEKPTAKASLPTGSDSGKSTAHATEPAAPAKVVPARAAPDVPRETGRLDF